MYKMSKMSQLIKLVGHLFFFIAKLQCVTSFDVAVGRERVDVCEEVVKRRKSSVQSVALL